MNQHQLLHALEAALNNPLGLAAHMRQYETEAGYNVVLPGLVSWLPLSDWEPDCVVSEAPGQIIRLVLIHARQPGTGAFTRLCHALSSLRLRPMVLAPTREFAKTLTRNGWKNTKVGRGMFAEAEDRWTQ
jgi:hypothetical protein